MGSSSGALPGRVGGGRGGHQHNGSNMPVCWRSSLVGIQHTRCLPTTAAGLMVVLAYSFVPYACVPCVLFECAAYCTGAHT